jgi:transaldolase
MNTLEELKKITTVVADSGDFETARKYRPQDATTNPSLVLQAAKLPAYKPLVDEAIQYSKANGGDSSMALDKLLVIFGCKYLELIPGRVSTEVDARLSYDTEGTIAKARHLIKLYKEVGISKERILIKIAATWEGIQAARILENEGIHCNVTLLFSLPQAAIAAAAKATLISPFVGRISDWYKKRNIESSIDPGVASVRQIYAYLKGNGYKTIVMGASFRSTEQILQLAGIDFLTISPTLLEQLANMQESVSRSIDNGVVSAEARLDLDEVTFKKLLKENEMASDLLTDGIRRFDEDAKSLQNLLAEKMH